MMDQVFREGRIGDFPGTMTPQRSGRREKVLSAEGVNFFPAAQRG